MALSLAVVNPAPDAKIRKFRDWLDTRGAEYTEDGNYHSHYFLIESPEEGGDIIKVRFSDHPQAKDEMGQARGGRYQSEDTGMGFDEHSAADYSVARGEDTYTAVIKQLDKVFTKSRAELANKKKKYRSRLEQYIRVQEEIPKFRARAARTISADSFYSESDRDRDLSTAQRREEELPNLLDRVREARQDLIGAGATERDMAEFEELEKRMEVNRVSNPESSEIKDAILWGLQKKNRSWSLINDAPEEYLLGLAPYAWKSGDYLELRITRDRKKPYEVAYDGSLIKTVKGNFVKDSRLKQRGYIPSYEKGDSQENPLVETGKLPLYDSLQEVTAIYPSFRIMGTKTAALEAARRSATPAHVAGWKQPRNAEGESGSLVVWGYAPGEYGDMDTRKINPIERVPLDETSSRLLKQAIKVGVVTDKNKDSVFLVQEAITRLADGKYRPAHLAESIQYAHGSPNGDPIANLRDHLGQGYSINTITGERESLAYRGGDGYEDAIAKRARSILEALSYAAGYRVENPSYRPSQGMEHEVNLTDKETGVKYRALVKVSWNKKYYSIDNGDSWFSSTKEMKQKQPDWYAVAIKLADPTITGEIRLPSGGSVNKIKNPGQLQKTKIKYMIRRKADGVQVEEVYTKLDTATTAARLSSYVNEGGVELFEFDGKRYKLLATFTNGNHEEPAMRKSNPKEGYNVYSTYGGKLVNSTPFSSFREAYDRAQREANRTGEVMTVWTNTGGHYGKGQAKEHVYPKQGTFRGSKSNPTPTTLKSLGYVFHRNDKYAGGAKGKTYLHKGTGHLLSITPSGYWEFRGTSESGLGRKKGTPEEMINYLNHVHSVSKSNPAPLDVSSLSLDEAYEELDKIRRWIVNDGSRYENATREQRSRRIGQLVQSVIKKDMEALAAKYPELKEAWGQYNNTPTAESAISQLFLLGADQYDFISPTRRKSNPHIEAIPEDQIPNIIGGMGNQYPATEKGLREALLRTEQLNMSRDADDPTPKNEVFMIVEAKGRAPYYLIGKRWKKKNPNPSLAPALSSLSSLDPSGDPDSDSYDSASAVSEMFHGRPVREDIEIQEQVFEHDNYAQLGTLSKLIFITEPKSARSRTAEEITLEFADPDQSAADVVRLCSDPEARTLYFIGGDQKVNIDELGFNNPRRIKDLIVLGTLVQVEYVTDKAFDDLQIINYYHQLGEDTKRFPILLYDTHNDTLKLAGGEYTIEDRGIVN